MPSRSARCRVRQRLAHSGRCGRAPTRARRRRRSTAARRGPCGRARARGGRRIPWSTSKSAVSRSVLTPFATSRRSITPIERVLLARLRRPAGDAVEVAELRDVLRQRDPVDGLLLERDRGRGSGPCAACDPGERVERVVVAGEGSERGAVLSLGGADPADRPVELAELEVRPRLRLALSLRGLDGEPASSRSRRARGRAARGRARRARTTRGRASASPSCRTP